MKVTGIALVYSTPTNSPEDIKSLLDHIARQHNVSVEELIKSARNVSINGPVYLVRASNLLRRLEKMQND